LLCAVGAVVRLSGPRWLGGFEALTFLEGGMAAMVFACLSFLAVLTQNTGKS